MLTIVAPQWGVPIIEMSLIQGVDIYICDTGVSYMEKILMELSLTGSVVCLYFSISGKDALWVQRSYSVRSNFNEGGRELWGGTLPHGLVPVQHLWRAVPQWNQRYLAVFALLTYHTLAHSILGHSRKSHNRSHSSYSVHSRSIIADRSLLALNLTTSSLSFYLHGTEEALWCWDNILGTSSPEPRE